MAAQTSYNFGSSGAFAGMVADFRVVKNITSKAAHNAIPFGYGVCAGDDAEKKVMIPKAEICNLAFSADFIADNVITVTVNGVAAAPITYATSHAATMTALIAAVHALSGVDAVAGSTNRIITITALNTQIVVSATVTGGVSQPTMTYTYSCGRVFRGVAVHKHTEFNGSSSAQYNIDDCVNVMDIGSIWVPVSEAVAVDDVAYVNTNSGIFSKTATANLSSGCKFASPTSGAGLAKLILKQ